MKYLYVIFDQLAQEVVGQIMTFAHPAPATRIFVDALTDPQSFLAKHPDDFALVELGTIEVVNNVPVIRSHAETVPILTGAAYKVAQEQTSEARN